MIKVFFIGTEVYYVALSKNWSAGIRVIIIIEAHIDIALFDSIQKECKLT